LVSELAIFTVCEKEYAKLVEIVRVLLPVPIVSEVELIL
jgi:hypothetical protein